MLLLLFEDKLSLFFFFSSRRRHTRWPRDWSSDVCSSDLEPPWCQDDAPARTDTPTVAQHRHAFCTHGGRIEACRVDARRNGDNALGRELVALDDEIGGMFGLRHDAMSGGQRPSIERSQLHPLGWSARIARDQPGAGVMDGDARAPCRGPAISMHNVDPLARDQFAKRTGIAPQFDQIAGEARILDPFAAQRLQL